MTGHSRRTASQTSNVGLEQRVNRAHARMARVLESETFFLGVSILIPFLRRLHGCRRLAAPFSQHHRRFAMTIQKKITPFLWYSKEAEEAAAFYAAIFPDSRVIRVTA